MCVKSEVFVVQVQVGVVKIRLVLAMVFIGGAVLVRFFVAVIHPVVEKPVGDDRLFLALHRLAMGCAEQTVALAVP
ncbi:hypothetical protein D3C77_398720 [compost metagenome]